MTVVLRAKKSFTNTEGKFLCNLTSYKQEVKITIFGYHR